MTSTIPEMKKEAPTKEREAIKVVKEEQEAVVEVRAVATQELEDQLMSVEVVVAVEVDQMQVVTLGAGHKAAS